jgi:microcystin-dependent protein
MATVTASYNWVSGETVTPAKLNTTAAPTVVVADNEVTTAKILDGNVTLAKLVTAVQQALLPAGAVQAFAMNSAPAGWLAANGNEYAKTGAYAALFAAISTTYGETNGSGGAGTSHFRVPDLQGIFVRGSGSQTIGSNTYSGTFANRQGDLFRRHTHAIGTSSNPASTSNTADPVRSSAAGLPNTRGGAGQDALMVLDSGETDADLTIEYTGGIDASNPGETRPANIALLYCIKF